MNLPRRNLLALTSTLCLVALAGPSFATANLNQAAPAFVGTTADGQRLDLASLKGKTVVLEWTNHDCPFVRKHYDSGNLQSLQKDATAQGVVWVQVISSAPGEQGFVDGPTALKLNTTRGAAATATVLDPDGSLGQRFGAKTTPHMYIVTPDGKLAYKGGIDSIPSSNKDDIAKAEPYVKLALADLAAGRAVAQASTRPYGCSVKYAK